MQILDFKINQDFWGKFWDVRKWMPEKRGSGGKFGPIQKMQIVDRFKNLKSFEGGPGGGRIQLNFKHLLKYADICGRPK